MQTKTVIWLGIGSMAMSYTISLFTLYVLFSVGYLWLAILIFLPLMYGMTRLPFLLMAKLRPQWFKPEWLKMQGITHN